MKYLSLSTAAAVLATLAVQAHAQEAPAPSPDATAPAPDADTAAPGATADAPVTDAEVDSFAQATVKVQKISADATLDQTAKQQQMIAAVKTSGLEPARFNQISKAVAADSELRAKVQMAMAKYATPPQG